MIRVGIAGGAGYTAGELIRLLVNHPAVELKYIQSGSHDGEPIHSVHSDLIYSDLKFSNIDFEDIDVLFIRPAVEIRRVCENTKNLIVLAPYMDTLRPGRGLGSVLPEAVKAAGAVGVMLNHAEHKLTIEEIYKTRIKIDTKYICEEVFKTYTEVYRPLKPIYLVLSGGNIPFKVFHLACHTQTFLKCTSTGNITRPVI